MLLHRGKRRWAHVPKESDEREHRKRISQFDDMDLNQIKPQYQHVKELENASADVRKIFTLEYADTNELLEAKLQQYGKTLKRHEFDYDSLEMQIARLTVWIRYKQEQYAKLEVKVPQAILDITPIFIIYKRKLIYREKGMPFVFRSWWNNAKSY